METQSYSLWLIDSPRCFISFHYTDFPPPETANILMNYVFKLHGFPIDIVSDFGLQFTSQIWKVLCKALGTSSSLVITPRPMDSQREPIGIWSQLLGVFRPTIQSYGAYNFHGSGIPTIPSPPHPRACSHLWSPMGISPRSSLPKSKRSLFPLSVPIFVDVVPLETCQGCPVLHSPVQPSIGG